MSHPAWVCGLKPATKTLQPQFAVTPCVGVWIETYNARIVKILHESHPAWVCGLKHPNNDSYVSIRGHTLRGCVD